jgi:hypothetical protein
VGQVYFGEVGHFYIGANKCERNRGENEGKVASFQEYGCLTWAKQLALPMFNPAEEKVVSRSKR